MNKGKKDQQVQEEELVEEHGDGSVENKSDERDEKIGELEGNWKRAVADYRNLEKRVAEERMQMVQFANRDLLLKLFPAFDTLFLAEKYVEDAGLKLSLKKLHDTLSEVGVERIEVEGKMYDPNTMEAVMTEEGEENKVLQELRPGYLLFGKILRPSQVTVGKKSE